MWKKEMDAGLWLPDPDDAVAVIKQWLADEAPTP
jgi:hypothetical protein